MGSVDCSPAARVVRPAMPASPHSGTRSIKASSMRRGLLAMRSTSLGLGEREQPLSTSTGLAIETLEAALAIDTGLHLGHDEESCLRERLVTFDADAIRAFSEPVEGVRQRSGERR